MKRWKYDYANATVVEVECETRGYPHKDADGEVQYENTHFDDEEAAWRKLLAEIEAGMSLGESARRKAQEKLDEITKDLADDAERLVRARRAHAERASAKASAAGGGS